MSALYFIVLGALPQAALLGLLPTTTAILPVQLLLLLTLLVSIPPAKVKYQVCRCSCHLHSGHVACAGNCTALVVAVLIGIVLGVCYLVNAILECSVAASLQSHHLC